MLPQNPQNVSHFLVGATKLLKRQQQQQQQIKQNINKSI
jgi:hypothetical protein